MSKRRCEPVGGQPRRLFPRTDVRSLRVFDFNTPEMNFQAAVHRRDGGPGSRELVALSMLFFFGKHGRSPLHGVLCT